MKIRFPLFFDKRYRALFAGLLLPCLILMSLVVTRFSKADDNGDVSSPTRSFSPLTDPNFPRELDVRGLEGTPHLDFKAEGIATNGNFSIKPTLAQLRSLNVLRTSLGLANLGAGVIYNANDQLQVQYNGLTATPRFLFVRGGYLTNQSSLPPEKIARDFINKYSGMFKFSQDDLDNLKLKSRAVTQEGTTILLFEQQINGLPILHGEVLVNVNVTGRIISVGGDSYPQMTIANSKTLTASDAITSAADGLKLFGFAPQSLGTTKVLAAYGDLPQTFVDGEKFSGGNVFSDNIVVEQVVFPVGTTGRIAYKFTLTTPQYFGIMWQNIVDAQTGAILRRASLTAFDTGGGVGVGRKTTFRPDIQNFIEANNAGGGATATAKGKVVDSLPTTFSQPAGVGRPVKTGNNYAGPTIYNAVDFTYALTNSRNENPLPFANGAAVSFTQSQLPALNSQVVHGLPDATNPSASSPFGWFYLPTGTGGSEITAATTSTVATRFYGYTLDSAPDTADARSAKSRNAAITGNSPTGNGDQPFSFTLTPLSSSKTLADGRVLSSVYQSNYAEGNNVSTSDDRANDNDSTRGVRAYSATRDFTAPRFDFYAGYEFGGVDAGATGAAGQQTGATIYPPSSDIDVLPADVALFNYNNIEHDYLYSIGFTEPLWNFQLDNFGKGGAAGDSIVAEVEDGSGTDNANMGTPAEGGNPRMQMYLFTDGGLRRSDGDLDFDVIGHEHYHGVSNRSAAKGGDGCLGITLVGESGGMGEGWSDAISTSMTDDDNEGEYVTGNMRVGIRSLAYTDYRYSYGAISGAVLNTRKNVNTDVATPGVGVPAPPYEVHSVGELWAATLWDVRELMIVKQKVNGSYPGVFFDGAIRSGTGTKFFIGDRQYQSLDTQHPINYRAALRNTAALNNMPVRPGMLASEIQSAGNRTGPLATAISQGATLADKIVLRGLQLAPCNPTFVDMRDSMLMADMEITGGENQAILWRAFTSHGVGTLATSTGGTNDTTGAGQSVPVVVEDFTVPTDVTTCETSGPLAAPAFTLTNPLTPGNSVNVAIKNVAGAASYIIQRGTSATGPFTTIATVAQGAVNTTYSDNNGGQGLNLNQTYYYVIHTARSANCVGYAGNVQSIAITNGTPVIASPVFFGVTQVQDPTSCTRLNVVWSPASSTNPTASIVYDVFRTTSVAQTDGTAKPTFTPSAANRIKMGVTGTSYVDTGLTIGQTYYYIVQARDTNNNRIDTNNVGNAVALFNAPTGSVTGTASFARENFEAASADAKFTPMLTNDSAAVNQSTPTFQRVSGVDLGDGKPTSVMYAPDFDPVPAMNQGGPSDFNTALTNVVLTKGSFLEFDHKFAAESTFDGGVLEVAVGGAFTPVPNATAGTYDLGNYIVQGGYSGLMDGSLAGGAGGSTLYGRYGYTGVKNLQHVRVALSDFAPLGAKNPNSLPISIRFRMASDVGSTAGLNSGWYIDNLVINNFTNCTTTAAGVPLSGRITDSNGRGLSRVRIALQTTTGETRYATTSLKGFYQFDDIQANSTVVLTPSLKGYQFDTQTFSLNEARSDVNFVAQRRFSSTITAQ